MSSKIDGVKLAASHPDHPAMSRDDLLAHAGKISQAIEACGASPELTTAVTLASELGFHLRRYFAAPVVERQPDVFIERHCLRILKIGEFDSVSSLLHKTQSCALSTQRVPLYAAPPELAELQVPTNGALIKDLTEVIAQQAAEIERLKGGQGEAAYWADAYDNTITATHKSHNEKLGGAPLMVVERYTKPLYTSQPAPVSVVSSGGHLRAEARQCDNCNHVGINDSGVGVGACHDCEWQGPEPIEDKCPGCDSENCMAAACPKCGARYVLIAEENLTIPDCLDKVKELNG